MKQKLETLRVRLELAYKALFCKTIFCITVEEKGNQKKKTVTILNYRVGDCLSDIASAHHDIAERINDERMKNTDSDHYPMGRSNSRIDVN